MNLAELPFGEFMETASVQQRDPQKKRPLSGPPFSKRLSGGNQRKLSWRRSGTGNGQSEKSRTSRVKLFKRYGLFNGYEMSIYRTKLVTGLPGYDRLGKMFRIR